MPRFIQEWRCDFCGFSHQDKSVVEAHEPKCISNPSLKSCYTCKHRDDAIGYPFGGSQCLAGVKNYEEIEDDNLSCDKWELEELGIPHRAKKEGE